MTNNPTYRFHLILWATFIRSIGKIINMGCTFLISQRKRIMKSSKTNCTLCNLYNILSP